VPFSLFRFGLGVYLKPRQQLKISAIMTMVNIKPDIQRKAKKRSTLRRMT